MKVTWVAGQASPYRVPVWEALGAHLELELALLESPPQFARRPGNRPRGFFAPEIKGVNVRQIRTVPVRRGENVHYAAVGPVLRPGSDAVVLGGWDSPAYFQAKFEARRQGSRVVAFYESTPESQSRTTGPIAQVRTRFFRDCDAVVVPGRRAEASLSAMGIDSERIFRGFNAVDVRAIRARATAARKDRPSRPQGHRYAFVGQLVPRKQPDVALEAFLSLADAGDSMVFIGDGPMLESLRARIQRAPDSRVTFLGNVEYNTVPVHLAHVDTLVLPSSVEVWGLVVNEALAAGCSVVVSDRCGVAAEVQGMTGVWIAAASVTGIADGMRSARNSWQGPTQEPEIMDHRPEDLAAVFERAVRGLAMDAAHG